MIKPDSPFMRLERIVVSVETSDVLRGEGLKILRSDIVKFLRLYTCAKHNPSCSDELAHAIRGVEGNA